MLIPFIVAVVLLAVDLISKSVVCNVTSSGETVTVIRGVLSFTYSENTGASFGLFGDHPVLLLVMTTLFTLGLIVFCVIKRNSLDRFAATSFWMIISGAIGNLYDRFAFGYVRDFIDYEFIGTIIGRRFAICNFADLVLIIGTVMLLVYVLFMYGKDADKKAADSTAATEKGTLESDTQTVSVDTAQSNEKKKVDEPTGDGERN